MSEKDNTLYGIKISVPKLLDKVHRILRVRGETFASLVDRLREVTDVKSRQTVYDWLNEDHVPRDPMAFHHIADILGVRYSDLMNPKVETPEVVDEPKVPERRGPNLAAILIDVLMNPESSETDKEVAKWSILRMLEERPRLPT